MGKFIILEDNSESLAQLYGKLREKIKNEKFLLIKCNYNQNYSREQADEKEREKLEQYIAAENRKYGFEDDGSAIVIMKSAEELLESTNKKDSDGNDIYEKDDILIMDITLFDNTDEMNEKNFSEYTSVQLAEKLVEQEKIKSWNVRFYTRATSKSDPSAFTKQTVGRWYVPVLRPNNFYALGVDNEVEIFISKILRKGG